MSATAQPYRLPNGGRIDRAAPLEREVQRPRPLRIRRRHDRLDPARAWRPFRRPLVQIPPSARNPLHGCDEPNALLAIDRGPGRIDPNNRASVVEARDGIAARSQNHWPSLDFDVGAINDMLSPVFAAGFYYKTFMWPRGFWDRVYEPAIRAAAGLGEAPSGAGPRSLFEPPRPLRPPHHWRGTGRPRRSAGGFRRRAKRIILADEGAEPGGALLTTPTATIDGAPAASWLAADARDTAAPRQCRLPAAHDRLRLLQSQSRRPRRARLRPSRRRAPTPRASASGRCAPGACSSRRARMNVRSSSPITTGRGSCWPRACALISIATPWRRGGASSSRPTAPPPIRRRPTPERPGIEATIVDLRPESDCAPAAAELRALGLRGADRPYRGRLDGPQARQRPHRRAGRRKRRRRRAARDRMRLRRHVGRLDAGRPSLLAVARQAALRRRARRFRSGLSRRNASMSRARRERQLRSRRLPRGRLLRRAPTAAGAPARAPLPGDALARGRSSRCA